MSDLRDPAEETARLDGARGIALLWLAMLAGPFAWLLALNVQYALVRTACTGGSTISLHLVTILALALAAGGVYVAWVEWRRIGGGWHSRGAGTLPRSRFMCIVGMMSGSLFVFAIVAQWLGTLFLDPCMGV